MSNSIICFLLLISALAPTYATRVLTQLAGPQSPLDPTTDVPVSFPQTPIAPPEVPGFPTDVQQPPTDVMPPVVGPAAPLPTIPVAPATSDDQVPTVLPPSPTPDVIPQDQPTPPDTDVAPPVVGPASPLPAVDPASPLPAVTSTSDKPALSFFMHDVLGGSQASGRVVTGIVATSDSSNIPFSKANNQVFPVSGGVPLFNGQVNSLVNNNNAPFLASMNNQRQQQQSNNLIQNAGNANNVINNNNNQAFVTAGQLPQGASLQELMFGSVTVIDDQITEGHELGSGVIGTAQGFYLASSLDGESHTMAWTAILHGGHESGELSTISFFGVHRPASPMSYVAVIGGTGIYENAKGYATLEALPQVDQHTTDGVETIVNVSVFLS